MIDRRTFLKTAAATATAAMSAPFAVRASDKAGTKPAIVGSGEHAYECHHNWGQAPESIRWYETHGVAVDPDGLVYVTHRAGADRPKTESEAQDTVVVFDPDGKFVRSFGKQWHGGGHGIDVRVENGQPFLYLAQMFPVNLVVKTDLKGEVVWSKDRTVLAGSHVYDDPAARYSPTNVAFAPDGGLYVADGYGSNYVHQLDKDGNWVRTWGGTGDVPGKMKTPHGVWFDARAGREPEVVVADRANARLQTFTPDGSLKKVVKDVLFPAHFDIRGDDLLVPDLHARVSIFDAKDEPIVHLGYDPAWTEEVKKMKIRTNPASWLEGRFIHPHDACHDAHGNLFVVEWVVPGRISWLKKV
jgi:hypothetical protein